MKARYRAYNSLAPQEIFSKIYDEGVWGKSREPGDRYFSGGGSRDPEILKSYSDAISIFLNRFQDKPDVVDLGCGDFTVGSAIRNLCGQYTACDIVPSLIEFNRIKFQALNVDFKIVDLIKDTLPKGEIVIIKEVLQHLSNDQIKAALPRIKGRYKYLVLTEEIPKSPKFKANIDKPAGPNTRIGVDSGVVLTSKPFSLERRGEETILEVKTNRALLRTIVYKFI